MRLQIELWTRSRISDQIHLNAQFIERSECGGIDFLARNKAINLLKLTDGDKSNAAEFGVITEQNDLMSSVYHGFFAGKKKRQIPLACHGFLYHCFMISESIGAVLILKTRERVRFTPALILFLLMAAAAEVINVAGHHILHDIHIEPNMFYITPYYASTQVVFNSIANALGILPEILIYLLLIILMSYVFFLLLVRRRKKDSAPV